MKRLKAALLTLALIGGSTRALAEEPMTMFGINRSSGQLVRYDLASATLTSVGAVRLTADGAGLAGIDASAYLPG